MKLDSVDQIIFEVENLSGGFLKAKEDLRLILEAAVSSQKFDELNELAFHAKYVTGLQKVIQKREAVVDEDYFKKIGDEFQTAYQKIKTLLQSIMGSPTSFVNTIFSEKYFQLTHESLQNLNRLCEDISFLKLYLNDLKTKKDSK
ncbi:MAG: hypothetical protein A2499_01950 [Stygiobacter sp. RIFOXYC12_FULL_38_8]|nr:MAG: hypothetical protein A2299_00170 [Stygiobacter sp. RIFOXYB2_FULL_37_11]OGV12165.1 MAG: hypothetical protein A2440_17820 [Stygiobacter sp. RIFOXYC2_FULL_38_25]OGV12211.1 MAG: hypothetical protein A2237_16225 [Stygiobacter sp. RIFOXYA2_FULL_38_8]OGV30454.1 MAG: hypothetical protein A2499_01950 [Stygiobacter sp. RIFOXYC12_FULL_38_8]OGV81291.1 MAG: hypothetical protein A2X65_00395 [Stygiobacter sp. GWF2_38_21]OGV98632.1 MAG: hypothetical protein A3J88_07850 [Melioribacter sp. RIFOXYB12_FUL